MSEFDWNQTRGFLTTAETGSLSAAARKLGLTQPTLSRQVAALEEELDVTLFERVGKKLELTETGLELLEHAKKMGAAADSIALSATGRSQTVDGLVSISASDGIAANLVPPILERLRNEAPQIQIEIVASNELSDLRRREADIAIRHVRPEEPELIAKLVREAKASFYASRDWVSRNGLPQKPEDAVGKDFIGFDRDERYKDHLEALGLPVANINFPLMSENSIVVWEMVKRGLGISVMMDDIARQDPDMVPILQDLPPIAFPIWLVTHRELHTSRRFRIVFDVLAEELAKV
ncbi:MAG: LysR family transcriptional regulator [Pseudomonadota bacterium]